MSLLLLLLRSHPDLSASSAVMTYPAESVQMGYQNHVEDIRSFLDSRHADHYTVFNLSQRNYRGAKFSNRVSECWDCAAPGASWSPQAGTGVLFEGRLPASALSSPARRHYQTRRD